MIKTRCILCGRERTFICKAEQKRRDKTHLCRQCFLKNTPKGIDASNYKRGYVIIRGYKLISSPNHPFVNAFGYVREHRLVMEKEIGRFLQPNEIIHHKDGNTLNNDISNLKIVTAIEHAKQHCTKNRKCSLCDRKHLARGYCMQHYWEFFLKDSRMNKKI